MGSRHTGGYAGLLHYDIGLPGSRMFLGLLWWVQVKAVKSSPDWPHRSWFVSWHLSLCEDLSPKNCNRRLCSKVVLHLRLSFLHKMV